VIIVDLKRSYKGKDKSKIFSRILIDKIADRLAKGEQIILLQNRRGHSAFLQCIDCGYIALCPNCAISLTYHSFNRQLQCHYCGYATSDSGSCPKCYSREIKYLGSGTQKIERELGQIFPQIRMIRMDLDTTTRKGAHDLLLKSFKEGKADILLGTQMIAKGLDFENVTLVGVISADVGLTLPDYRASERVFQLLTQVAGRAGRGIIKGEVVIQTYLYTHYAIQLASNHDYCGFYDEEIIYRESLGYPPFQRMINIRISGSNFSDTIENARVIAKRLMYSSANLFKVVGPAPCPISKIKNMYRWQILIKLNSEMDPTGRRSKQKITDCLESYLRYNKKELKVAIDVDPVDMM
jgi:primosomal protein N' (replication factor Y)